MKLLSSRTSSAIVAVTPVRKPVRVGPATAAKSAKDWEALVTFLPSVSTVKRFEIDVIVQASTMVGAVGRAAREAKKKAPKGRWAELIVSVHRA